jgi:hypothetical protein
MRISIFIISIILTSCFVYAQPAIPDALAQQLEGKSTFYEFRQTVLSFYQEGWRNAFDSTSRKANYKKLKHWNRYFWWNEHFVSGDGKIEDYNQRVMEAKEHQAKYTSDSLRHQAAGWTQEGPEYSIFDLITGEGIGRFDVVAFHPTNTNIIFAGSPNGGIFKTVNGGSSWSSISEYLPSLGVAAICVHPTNPNIIYVLSGDRNSNDGSLVDDYQYRSKSQGVYKTTDGGDTWKQTDTFPMVNFKGRDLIMDVANPSTLLAATSKGIVKTTNGGQSWTLVEADINFWELEYKPGSSSVVYAAANSAFFRSDDGGNSFSDINYSTLLNGDRISMAVTPADDDVVMLFVGANSENDEMVGIFKSTNSGLDFDWIFYGEDDEDDLFNNYMDIDVLNGQSIYNNTIAISPTDANIVVVGGLCIWGSDDGGETWVQETAYWAGSEGWGAEHIHPDQHQLAYNTDGKLYCANDGGIYVSDDDGDAWDFIEHGLTTTQFYHFEVYNDEDDTWGGTQDNGIMEEDLADGGYYKYWSGDGYDVMTDHPWQVDDGESDDIYYTVNSSIRSDNTDISISSEWEEFFGNLAMDPTDEDHIYVGYSDLYESFDAGDSWEILSTRNASWCVATCKSNADRLYFAGPGGSNISTFTRFEDGIETFLTGRLIEAGFVDGLKITDIEVSTTNSNNVYVSSAGFEPDSKVFFSNNGGDTWDNLSFNLPNVPVFSLVRDPSGGIYAGTYIGVYYKRSGVNYWEPFYNGLPPVPVTEMELYNFLNGGYLNIMISTFGRGLWKTQTYQALCPGMVTLSGNIEGPFYKDAASEIQSSHDINASVGTVVKYNAGDQIRLVPGFHAKGPGLFKTYLSGCGAEIEND